MRDKRISSLIAGLIAILIMLPAPAYASVDTLVPAKDSEVWNVNLEEDETEYDIERTFVKGSFNLSGRLAVSIKPASQNTFLPVKPCLTPSRRLSSGLL